MNVSGIANSAQLDMLVAVLDDQCRLRGVIDPGERERIASQIIHLYNAGLTTAEGLNAGLSGPLTLRQTG